MKPFIRITVDGGVVQDVESNLPGTEVTIFDVDAKRSGDEHTTILVADFPPEGMELPNTERLTDDEIDRFEAEMEGNLDGSLTTQAVLLHIIKGSPQACALFRAWLAEAEAFTKEAEGESGEGDPGAYGLEFAVMENHQSRVVLETAYSFKTIQQAEDCAFGFFIRGLAALEGHEWSRTVSDQDIPAESIVMATVVDAGGERLGTSYRHAWMIPDDDHQPSDLTEHSDFAQDDLPEHETDLW